MLAIASLATGFVVAAVTPSHANTSPAVGLPGAGIPDAGLPGAGLPGTGGGAKLTGGETKVAGVNLDQALNTVGRAVNRETDRAVNNAPHGKKR
ncbi:hypothetical protein ABZ078_35900 [Streptomyces sp. NPDC006385]|uniref:hypothetical protein n=1 Tax=Streptomyces sp. NPDC006385 TaxID=3156761 RepID=UPI0033A99D70